MQEPHYKFFKNEQDEYKEKKEKDVQVNSHRNISDHSALKKKMTAIYGLYFIHLRVVKKLLWIMSHEKKVNVNYALWKNCEMFG